MRTYEEAKKIAQFNCLISGGTLVGEDYKGYFHSITKERLTREEALEMAKIDENEIKRLMVEEV